MDKMIHPIIQRCHCTYNTCRCLSESVLYHKYRFDHYREVVLPLCIGLVYQKVPLIQRCIFCVYMYMCRLVYQKVSFIQRCLFSSAGPVLVGGKASQLANHLTSQLKTTSAPPTQPSNRVVNSSSETSQTSSETSLAGSSAQEENGPLQSSNKSTATQALEASTLLQQQGGGEVGGASGVLPSITAELIAQCFLNLPNNTSVASSSVTTGSDSEDNMDEGIESVAMATDATVSAANVLAALGSLSQGVHSMYM